MRVLHWIGDSGYIYVQCIGTTNALLAAGCLTNSMIATRDGRSSRNSPLRDENNKRFHLSRFPSSKTPERMLLTRFLNAESAMQLPRMREMFPEGFPEKENSEREDTSPPRSSRADFCTSMLNMVNQCARGDHPNWPQAMPADTQRLIKQHVGAILEVFRCSDSKRKTVGPSFLRLVVDNTR